MKTKEIIIKIDKGFIEESVFQENWGEIKIEESHFKNNLQEHIKDNTNIYIKEVIKNNISEMLNEKEIKNLLTNKIKAFIESMSSSELFYRDDFRKYLVEKAQEQETNIVKKISSFLETEDFRRSIENSIGDSMFGYLSTKIYEDKQKW